VSFRGAGSVARRALAAIVGAAAILLFLSAVNLAVPRSAAPLSGSAASSAPEASSGSAAATVAAPAPSDDAVSSTSGPEGLSESDAVAAARGHLPESDRDAELWATMSGTFADVSLSLGHRPPYLDQPTVDDVAADRPVWGVGFQLTVEICGPAGGTCESRKGLSTIFIDYESGDWLRSSTFAPSPGEPLPRPKT
jgi:hypothetical protein